MSYPRPLPQAAPRPPRPQGQAAQGQPTARQVDLDAAQDIPPPACAWSAEPMGRVAGAPRPAAIVLPAEARDADVLLVNTSAGKDSLAMLLAVHRAWRALPAEERPALLAVHADLGRVEWPGTRELAERQANALGIPLVIVRRERGGLLEQVRQRGMWPSSTARYCTSDQKTAQVHKLMTRAAAAWRKGTDGGLGLAWRERRAAPGPCRIVSALGLRAAESAGRAKRLAGAVAAHPQRAAVELEKKPTGKGTRKVVHRWFPLHLWGAADVWAEIDAAGRPDLVHPAYTEHGMPRLSCVFCIYAPRSALVRAGYAARELLSEYAELEESIGHTFRQDIAIGDVLAAVEAGEEPGEVRTWEM